MDEYQCPYSYFSFIQQAALKRFLVFKRLQSVIVNHQDIWNDVDKDGIFQKHLSLHSRYCILIAGQGKAGKSTFINELFRGSVELPWDDLQCTKKFTRITSSKDDYHRISFKDTNDCEYDEESFNTFNDEISHRITNYKMKETFVELKISSPIICDGLVIIDSPGIGQSAETTNDFATFLPHLKPNLLLFLYNGKETFGPKNFQYYSTINNILDNNIDDKIIIANKLDKDLEADNRDDKENSEDLDDEDSDGDYSSVASSDSFSVQQETKQEEQIAEFSLSEDIVLNEVANFHINDADIFLLSSGGILDHRKSAKSLRGTRLYLDAFLKLETHIENIIFKRSQEMIKTHADLLKQKISQIMEIQEKKDLRSCVDQVTRETNIKSLKNANLSKNLKRLHKDILHHFKDLLDEKWSIDNFKDQVLDIMNMNQVTFGQVSLVSLDISLSEKSKLEENNNLLQKNMKQLSNVTSFLIDRCFYIVRNSLRLLHDDKMLDKDMRKFKQALSSYLPNISPRNSLFLTDENFAGMLTEETTFLKKETQLSSNDSIVLRREIKELVSDSLQKVQQIYIKNHLGQMSKDSSFNIDDYIKTLRENQSFIVNKVVDFAQQNSKAFEEEVETAVDNQLLIYQREISNSQNSNQVEEVVLSFKPFDYLKTWIDVVSLLLPKDFVDQLQLLTPLICGNNYCISTLKRHENIFRVTSFNLIGEQSLSEDEATFNLVRTIFNLENVPFIIGNVWIQKLDKVYINANNSKIYSISPHFGKRLVDCSKDLTFSEKEFIIRAIFSALKFIHCKMRIVYNFRPDNIYYFRGKSREERTIVIDCTLPCHPKVALVNNKGEMFKPFFIHPAVSLTYPGMTAGHEIYAFGWLIWLLLMENLDEAPEINSGSSTLWLQTLRKSQRYIDHVQADYLKKMMAFCWGIDTATSIDYIYNQLSKICGDQYYLHPTNLEYKKGYYH